MPQYCPGFLLVTEHSILLTAIIFLSYLLGQTITGDLVLKVSDKISPLEPLDIFLQLKYQNLRGDEKLNTTHKPTPPYVAGVPGFSLRLNGSTNQIRIGGRAKFSFNILMRRIVSTLKVEVLVFFYEKYILQLVTTEGHWFVSVNCFVPPCSISFTTLCCCFVTLTSVGDCRNALLTWYRISKN